MYKEDMLQDVQWIQQLEPLPSRVIPQPWEDLPSLIIRTAERMGYKSPNWILQAQEVPYIFQPSDLRLLSKYTDYRVLQHLLQLDEETLYRRTYHRFVSGHASFCRLPGAGR